MSESKEVKEETKKQEPKKTTKATTTKATATKSATKTTKKAEPKKVETNKKPEKIVVTKAGGGISMKNWIFIVLGGFILAFAGFYFGQLSMKGTIQNYQTQVQELQQKQNIIQQVIENTNK